MKDKKIVETWYQNGKMSAQSAMDQNFIIQGIFKSWDYNGQADYIDQNKKGNGHGIKIRFEYKK